MRKFTVRDVASSVSVLGLHHQAVWVPLGVRCRLMSVAMSADQGSENLGPQHAADMQRLARRLRLGSEWQSPNCTTPDGIVVAYETMLSQGKLRANANHFVAVGALSKLPPALEPCRDARRVWDVEQERLAVIAEAADEKLRKENEEAKAHAAKVAEMEIIGLGRLERARSAVMDNRTDRLARAEVAVNRAQRDLSRHGPPPKLHPAGCYLYGPVGTGKSTMMDMMCLFGHQGFRLRRQHFHEFSLWLNEFLRVGGTDGLRPVQKRPTPGSDHKLARIADRAAEGIDILCLDEFAVTNVADAAIFSEIFRLLAERYVSVVCTTNRPPEELYSQGLHRDQHVPTLVNHLRENFIVVTVDGPDYRQEMLRADVGNGGGANAGESLVVFDSGDSLTVLEAALANDPKGVPELAPTSAKISWGRSMKVPLAGGGVACFHFNDLCRPAFSADDFLYLAMEYHTICLHGIPELSIQEHNEARRFTNFVDAAYEHSVRLICQSSVPLDSVLSGVESLLEVNVDSRDAGRFGVYEADTIDDTPFFASDENKKLQNDRDAQRMRGEAQRLGRMAAPEAVAGTTGSGWSPAPAASDLSAPQDGVAGVMVAAVGSLQESGFAARRAMSRLKEMRTAPYLEVSRQRREATEMC